jgi:hypothetical protein
MMVMMMVMMMMMVVVVMMMVLMMNNDDYRCTHLSAPPQPELLDPTGDKRVASSCDDLEAD